MQVRAFERYIPLIIVGIWVHLSMIDFMLNKDKHERVFFATFTEKSGATLWRYVHDDVMSHINIKNYNMVEH